MNDNELDKLKRQLTALIEYQTRDSLPAGRFGNRVDPDWLLAFGWSSNRSWHMR